MYDEFGNLKKKYRVKTNQADTRPAVAAGRAGWQVEELGNFLFYFNSENFSMQNTSNLTQNLCFRTEPLCYGKKYLA